MSNESIGRLFAFPESLADLPGAITTIFSEFAERAVALVTELGVPTCASDLREAERSLFRLVVRIADQIVACLVWLAHSAAVVLVGAKSVREAAEAARGHKLKRHRRAEVMLRFLGGSKIPLPTPYDAPDYSGRPGRRRTFRRKSGSGCYPILEHLGFVERHSPATASEVAYQATALSSFQEATEGLARRGLDLDVKSVRRLAELYGERVLRARDDRVEAFERGEGRLVPEFVGARVALVFDGGRTRTRISRKRGRKRKKTGRRGYDTPWREPKLVAIYAFDERGQKIAGQKPVYEGTFECWDDAFRIFTAECARRGVAAAREIVVLGDGSSNIWDRVDELLARLGLDPRDASRVIDYYHAVEHLHELAQLCRRWSKTKRQRWLAKMKQHLKAGRVEKLIEAGEALRIGRRATKVVKALAYFRKHKDKMRYGEIKARGIPIGSGVVESAIRRVVNLRLKAPGTFWEVDNAERLLALRARLKAGRWNDAEREATSIPALAGPRRLLPRERTRIAA